MLSVFSKKEGKPSKPVAFSHGKFFLEAAKRDVLGICQQLHTTLDGLTTEEVKQRQTLFGFNELTGEQYIWQKQLLKILINPFVLLLTVLAVVSYLTGDLEAALVMASMVVLSSSLTFFQEFRSNKAAESLKQMVSTKATVNRITGILTGHDGRAVMMKQRKDVPLSELVPGDVVHLAAGDMIPADVRLLSAKDLFLSQSALTGEAMPVEKFADVDTATQSVLDLKNTCYMGSTVISGTAVSVVLKTGADTFVGSIAKSISTVRPQTSFDMGIHRFTWLMLRFMFVMVPLVFVINGLSKGDWFESFLFAVAVAVGLTPEMLPMIVTVNLAKGALAMAKKRVIVKRLSSIQNFGAMDVLCTDKTGTLTQDNVVLEKYVGTKGREDLRVLEYSFLNSYYQTGLKNLLDRAILNHVEVGGKLKVEGHYRKEDEVPFDFNRRRMSVIVTRRNETHVLICKGAIEEMFSVCTQYDVDGKLFPLDEGAKKECFGIAEDLNDDGLRVVAVAYREEPIRTKPYSIADEQGLVLLGFVAFLDPPKESTQEALRVLRSHGVDVKVLTGDNDRVTRKICSIVGIPTERILLGSEVEALSESELAPLVVSCSVFAKLTPSHKERIVKALRLQNRVVGFLGDGINDSPALKAADVGISVDTGVDIAKESADIILLEKNLLVLGDGILEGRKVFGNIVKYIKMGASSNFGNVFSILGASIALPFLPMMPVQLLTQNLLYDISQTAIPFDDVDQEYLEKPRRWQIGEIGRFMFFLGPVSSLFDFATFGVMWFVLKANTPAQQSLFQSGWFVEGLLSQTLIVHIIRTRKIPFFQSRGSLPLMIMTVLVMGIGLCIPFTSFGQHIGFTPLPRAYFGWLVGILISYSVLAHLAKTWFIERYGFN